jgi:hypothetical protein
MTRDCHGRFTPATDGRAPLFAGRYKSRRHQLAAYAGIAKRRGIVMQVKAMLDAQAGVR